MRSWFQRFMAGRYGFDQLGGFLCIVSFILVIIGAWVSPVLYWLGLVLLIYCYFRVLSRNRSKRYAENLKISHPAKQSRGLGQPVHPAL